jgi:hypothetical protein
MTKTFTVLASRLSNILNHQTDQVNTFTAFVPLYTNENTSYDHDQTFDSPANQNYTQRAKI